MSEAFLCWSIRIFCLLRSSSFLSSSKKACEHRRGFPIMRRTLHHSTLVSFRAFNCGNDSFKQIVKSLSPSNSVLKNVTKVIRNQSNLFWNIEHIFITKLTCQCYYKTIHNRPTCEPLATLANFSTSFQSSDRFCGQARMVLHVYQTSQIWPVLNFVILLVCHLISCRTICSFV